jgi:hypothetical protein
MVNGNSRAGSRPFGLRETALHPPDRWRVQMERYATIRIQEVTRTSALVLALNRGF